MALETLPDPPSGEILRGPGRSEPQTQVPGDEGSLRPLCRLFTADTLAEVGEGASGESFSAEMEDASFAQDEPSEDEERRLGSQSRASSVLSYGSDYQSVSVEDIWARNAPPETNEPDTVKVQRLPKEDAWSVFSS